jgi:hypothetical protein
MDSIIWNIAAFLSPLILLTFLCHQAGEKIRYSKFLPWRTVGLSLVAIVWVHLAAETRKRQSKLDDERKL